MGRLSTALPAVREHAVSVDADANYSKASIEALGAVGLLGLTLSPDVGGSGATPDQSATVVAAVAERCGSTAMVSPRSTPRCSCDPTGGRCRSRLTRSPTSFASTDCVATF